MNVKTNRIDTHYKSYYEVSYGQKDVQNRNVSIANTEKEAIALFRKKEKLGLHVDVQFVEVNTSITVTKLTL